MRRYPYTDDDVVEEGTQYWLRRGTRIFQAHLVGGTEFDHCVWLLEQMKPARNARILDIASGVGGVADIMSFLRPDLQFTLLNISPSQLRHSPEEHHRVCADMESLPFPDKSFDHAMICYALGHGDARTILREARRVARSVLVLDVLAEKPEPWLKELNYTIPTTEEMCDGVRKELRYPDGGAFEALLPGFWKETGAYEVLLTC